MAMVDPSTIGSALSALKAAKDIAEAMAKLRKDRTFDGKHAELLSKIIDINEAVWRIQQERAALLERIGELEKQADQFEAWESEKQKYELLEVSPGAFVYTAKKTTVQGDEPPHWLCATCYERGKKRLLQRGPLPTERRLLTYACGECSNTIHVFRSTEPGNV